MKIVCLFEERKNAQKTNNNIRLADNKCVAQQQLCLAAIFEPAKIKTETSPHQKK